ncbi:MAG: hypothetical protein ACI9D5_001878 [Candidatus Endobugula sp.]
MARQCALFLVVHHFNLSACPHKPLLRKPDEIEAFLERGNSLCNMLRKRMLRTHGSLVVDVLLIAKNHNECDGLLCRMDSQPKKPNKKPRRQLTQCIESSAINPSEKTGLVNSFLFFY